MLSGDHIYSCEYCAANPGFYTLLGHDGKPNGAWEKNLVTGDEFERCPKMTLIQANADKIKEIQLYRDELYPLYRAGHLPRAGGALDQDARALDYFREFDHARAGADAAYLRIVKADGDGDGDTVE